MSFLSTRAVAIGLLLTFGLFTACMSTAKDVFKGVDRVVVVGDLHGDYDQYIKFLTTNGLVDEELRWQGGKTHFVQLGDVVDRGTGRISDRGPFEPADGPAYTFAALRRAGRSCETDVVPRLRRQLVLYWRRVHGRWWCFRRTG